LNIVGHSHGGNVGILVSQKTDKKIDNLVTLATPVRSDYQPNYDNIGRHINAYSNLDIIQSMGGNSNLLRATISLVGVLGVWASGQEFGPAGRTYEGAENIDVTKESFSLMPWRVHSNFWQDTSVWDRVGTLYP
jgi:hypothetical protein